MPRKTRKRLPSDLPRARVLRAIEKLGFVLKREGSKHTIYVDPNDARRLLSIPRHSRIKRNLLRGVLSGVHISEENFMRHY